MGNKQQLSQAEVQELCNETSFTPQEIKRIYKRFVSLDTFKRGYVTVSDLMSVPELDQNPLGERVCKVFAMKNSSDQTIGGMGSEDGEGGNTKNMVDFKEFVKALSAFALKQPSKEEEKLRFLFRVYDLDGDGLLSQEEMRAILRKIVGPSLTETEMHQIIDRTLSGLEVDDEGKIDYQQFCKIFKPQQNELLK